MKLSLPGPGSDVRFLALLNIIIGDTRGSMIDLCCHHARLTQALGFRQKTFVDVGPHGDHINCGIFVQADVINGDHWTFEEQHDVALCLDGIEHVHKPEGWKLLERMKSMSAKQILFTPLDPWMLDPENPDPESHKCVWSPDELGDEWASIVLPEYHPSLGIGAFFFWRSAALNSDFERVLNEIKDAGL